MRAFRLVMETILAASILSTSALASDVCATVDALEHYDRQYRVCIVEKAVAFSRQDDSADVTASAAVAACSEYRQRIEDHVNLCNDSNGLSGAQTMAQLSQEYHDFAVRAVLESRAQRKANALKLGSPP